MIYTKRATASLIHPFPTSKTKAPAPRYVIGASQFLSSQT